MNRNVDASLLILRLWREASRPCPSHETATRIAEILREALNMDALYLLELDLEAAMIIPRAFWSVTSSDKRHPQPRSLDRRSIGRLRRWLEDGAVSRGNAKEKAGVSTLLLDGPTKDAWLAAPLFGEGGVTGSLVLCASPPLSFLKKQEVLLRSLTEPLAALLENRHRLLEIDAARRVAEADKSLALTKLGRDELSETIIGASGGLSPVMVRIDLVAGSDMPVLLFGETGSGKELIARTIHQRSKRAGGPFIRVNCGAIPPELVDSQLFGHEKGAFTGATGSVRGWFERAHEGTLLLDEVAELPLAAQVRLLRVLQEGTFERVGGERAIYVDVRIIAATHADLPARVQAGKFREDLWYRLFSFPILIPPLRERTRDLSALAEHLSKRAARRFGLRPCEPTAKDLELLAAYPWPGNIRELASVIDRAALLGDGRRLAIAESLGTSTGSHSSLPDTCQEQKTSVPRIEPLDDAIIRHIERALIASRGRIEGKHGAAHILDVNPHTLRAKMRKLGIDWSGFRQAQD